MAKIGSVYVVVCLLIVFGGAVAFGPVTIGYESNAAPCWSLDAALPHQNVTGASGPVP
jgi:hypothetical protein